MRRATWMVLMAAIGALVLPAAAQARPATAAKDGRPNILVVMTDDQATTDLKHMPNVKRLLARAGHDLRRRGRLVPALLPRSRDLHHRPVRPQPRGHGQLLALRLVRHEGPRQHPSELAAEGGLPHGDDRQVAQRLRRARRSRRGAGRVRHLARPARCVGLRLLQLRDEQRRRPPDLGGRRLRAQAGRVREDPGDPQRRGRVGRVQRAERRLRARPLRLLGGAEPRGLLARRDRRDHRGPRPLPEQVQEAVLHLVVARPRRTARTWRSR